jgi:flagellar basal-body rod modification protein FlgD
MATVNPITAATNGSTGAAASASAKLADTYDSFLKLLTTQLKHQDPLSPMDSNQFISQLVEFSSVEQQIAANANLEKLIALQSSGIAGASIGYLGKTVEATGDRNTLANGAAEYAYTLQANAVAATATVLDAQGRAVYAGSVPSDAGRHVFTWNGKDFNGNTLPDGEYRIRIDAVDSNGAAIPATTSVIGKVTSVEQTADGPMLLLGSTKIPLSKVTAVKETITTL